MSQGLKWLRAAAWIAAAVLLFLALATARVVLDGERELAASDAAFAANDLHEAIAHARRAASAYAPGAPHVRLAFERLFAIARGAESSGQAASAVLAWEAVRAAALEVRHVTQPYTAELSEAERNLARLSQTSRSDRSTSEVASAPRTAAEPAPSTDARWGALLPLGLLCAAVGVVLAASRAFEQGSAPRWRRGAWGAALFVIGAACYALAAYRA